MVALLGVWVMIVQPLDALETAFVAYIDLLSVVAVGVAVHMAIRPDRWNARRRRLVAFGGLAAFFLPVLFGAATGLVSL